MTHTPATVQNRTDPMTAPPVSATKTRFSRASALRLSSVSVVADWNDVDAALAPGAPQVHTDPKSYAGAFTHPAEPKLPNVCGYMRWQHGELDAGFAAADQLFEHTFHTPTEHHGYIEPHAVLADVKPDGRGEVWASNKSPYMLRAQLAACFGVEGAGIKLHNLHIGGDFGGKGSQMEAPVAYLLSREAGRPVKLVMSYTEELMAANARHAARVDIKTGVKRDGTITAMHVDLKFNGGAYGAYKPMPNLNLHGADQAASCYRVPAIDIHSTVVYTNTIPGGHMRSPGCPQTMFAVEAQFDIIARALGMEVAGISMLTNWAAGLKPQTLHHAEVVEVGKTASLYLARLLKAEMRK